MIRCKARERRTNNFNSSERNKAGGRFSSRPTGAAQTHQYSVAVLDKGVAILCGLRLVLMRLSSSEYNSCPVTGH